MALSQWQSAGDWVPDTGHSRRQHRGRMRSFLAYELFEHRDYNRAERHDLDLKFS
jgi:hypothetical protein